MPADGELHDAHLADVADADVHGAVVLVVAHQADAALLVGAVDVLHGQVVVAAAVERHEVHLAVDDVPQVVDELEAHDVARLQDGVHRVAADVDRAVARGDVGHEDFAQHVLVALLQYGLEVGGGGDVVERHAAVVHPLRASGRVQQLHVALHQLAVAIPAHGVRLALARQQPVVVNVLQLFQHQGEVDAVARNPVAQRRARHAQVVGQLRVGAEVQFQLGALHDVCHAENRVPVRFLFYHNTFCFFLL